MARMLSKRFLLGWLVLSLLGAMPFSCVAFGLSRFRPPESFRDLLVYAGIMAIGAVVILPVTFLLAFFIAELSTSSAKRRERRAARGYCVSCGYDLTGNESGRCPECGERVCRSPSGREGVGPPTRG